MSTSSRSKHAINLWRRLSLNDCSRLSFSEGSPPRCGDDDRECSGDDEEDPARLCWRVMGRLTRRSGSARPVSCSRSQRKKHWGAAHHSRSPLRLYARTRRPGALGASQACRRTRHRGLRTSYRARPHDRARLRAARSCRPSRRPLPRHPSARSSTRSLSSSAARSCPHGAGTTSRGSAR